MLAYEFSTLNGKDDVFYFTTDLELAYEILFEPSGYIFPNHPDLDANIFELVIKLVANSTGKRTPPDSRIAATVAGIFKAFMAHNERVLVYICDSSDRRQLARARKFSGWFEEYGGIDFIKIDRLILDPSGDAYITSLLMRHDNPQKIRIFEAFDKLTSGQAEDKL